MLRMGKRDFEDGLSSRESDSVALLNGDVTTALKILDKNFQDLLQNLKVVIESHRNAEWKKFSRRKSDLDD